jgi:hypothetical protein
MWISLLAAAILLPGCMKYDDGPFMSLYSKGMRVAGNWYFESVLYGGKDSTEHYSRQMMNFVYLKEMDGGAFSWNRNIFATSADDDPMVGGSWKFYADRDSFQMVVYRNLMKKDSVIMNWKIKRLAYTEFWMERYIKDTIKVEWQLIKYAY